MLARLGEQLPTVLHGGRAMNRPQEAVQAELVAVAVGVLDGAPRVLTTSASQLQLPAGPLREDHRSMQAGLRAWVEEKTGLRLGYVEQLYTFADRDRAGSQRTISVSYLGLTWLEHGDLERWVSWYDLFPWEDQRDGGALLGALGPHLRAWANAEDSERREVRCRVTFGLDGTDWHPELALQRYEVLYEAGLVPESPDSREALPPQNRRSVDAARPSQDRGHRDGSAAREDPVPTGRLRADAAGVHAGTTSGLRGGDREASMCTSRTSAGSWSSVWWRRPAARPRKRGDARRGCSASDEESSTSAPLAVPAPRTR